VPQITVGRKEDGALQRKSFKGRTKAICKERRDTWLAEQEALKEQAQNEQNEAAAMEARVTKLDGMV